MTTVRNGAIITNAMWNLNERDIRMYGRFSDGGAFADLVNQIIYAHCFGAGVPQSAISTNLKSVRDGGVDTKVEHGLPHDHSGWMDCPTIWQFKASAASDLGPSDLRKEIAKDYAAQLIREGYAYRFCVCDSLPDEKKAEWRNILGEEARAIFPGCRSPLVLGTDEFAAWMRDYPSIALLVHPDLDRLSKPINVWGRQAIDEISHYVSVPTWRDAEQRMRDHVDFGARPSDVVFPITGEPGVGKTRLVYEVLANLGNLAGLVMYTENDQHAEDLARQLAVSTNARAIVVADECSVSAQQQLHRTLQTCRDRVRVIAIDNSGDRAPTLTAVQRIDRMSDENVRQVLEQNFPHVPPDRRDLYVDRVDGYLRLAADMCRFDAEIAAHGTIAPVLATVDSYLRARLSVEERQVVEALALVYNVGYRDDVGEQFDFLCQATGLPRQEATRIAHQLHDAPGFVARAGRFLYVTPEVVAQAAFERAWRVHCAPDFAGFVERMNPALLEPFLKRVNKSASAEVRRSVDAHFRGLVASFRPEYLASVRTVNLMLTFCEIYPDSCLPVLRTAVEGATHEQLLATNQQEPIAASPRRQLVWFCERMAAFPEYFDDIEAILQRLALAENEASVGNNATNTWKELFRISLSGTAIPFFLRIDRLERYIRADDTDLSALALDAFNLVFNIYAGRIVGPPLVAGRIPPPMWEPTDDDEFRACIDRAVELLVSLSGATAERGRERVQEVAITHARMLIRFGFLSQMGKMFNLETLSDEMRARLIAAIEDALRIEFDRNKEDNGEVGEYELAVRAWMRTLLPIDFHGRLLSTIGADPWHHGFVRGEQTRDAEIASLAQELVGNRDALGAEMPWLCSPGAKGVVYLGFALGRLDDSAALLGRIVEEGRRFDSPGLARGYIGGLLEAWPEHQERVDALLDELETMAPPFAYQLFMMIPEKAHAFERTLRMIDAGALPSAYLGGFNFDLAVDGFDVSRYTAAMTRLIAATEAGNRDAQRVALDLIGASLHDRERRRWAQIVGFAPLLDLIWRLLATTTATGTMETYQWHEALEALADVDAERTAEIAAASLVGEDYGLEKAGISVLLTMSRAQPAAVMEAIGRVALDPDKGRIFFLHDFESLFRSLPAEIVEGWLEKEGIDAARRLARHLPPPMLDERGEPYVEPLTAYVLEQYGEDERVRTEFYLGTHSGQIYTGDMASQMEREADVAERFLRYPIAAIQEWARRESANQRYSARQWREREQEQERHRD